MSPLREAVFPQALDDLLGDAEGDVVLDPREWQEMLFFIPDFQIVAATADEPAFFWYRGHRFRSASFRGDP